MTTIPATEAKNKFGDLLEAIQSSPVEISRKGRPVAIVLSIKDYEEIQNQLSFDSGNSDFSGITGWINEHKKMRTRKPLNEDDYKRHLDEKYAS